MTVLFVFFFKQKTAYEMRISDWSSDVCSSDLMVTTATTLPIYATRDQVAFRAWGKYRGVKVSVVGPSDWNIPAQIKAIEEVIPSRPAGLQIGRASCRERVCQYV